MRHFEGRRFTEGWVVVLALGLGACGGTVDLRGEGGGGGGGSGGERPGAEAEGGAAGKGSGKGGTYSGSSGGPGAGSGGIVGSAGHGGGFEAPTQVTPGPILDASEVIEVDDGVVLEGKDLGRLLAYDANPDGLGSAIYLTSLDAPGCWNRLTDPAVQAKQPVFSADGSRLAYAARTGRAHQIHVLDLESGKAEQVTDLPYGATGPSFSADGTRIAFLSGDIDAGALGVREGEFDVMVLDLEARTQRVVLASTDGGCCVPKSRVPTFFGNQELALQESNALIAINLDDFSRRDIMPLSGRIPEPRDPSPAPDGVRYAYSDYCGGAIGMYIGRIDGSSGDTCAGATSIPSAQPLLGADWGPFGKIAANIDRTYGLVSIDDTTLEVTPLASARGARNPAWGPATLELPLTCQEAQ